MWTHRHIFVKSPTSRCKLISYPLLGSMYVDCGHKFKPNVAIVEQKY